MNTELEPGEHVDLDTGTTIKRGSGDHSDYYQIMAVGMNDDHQSRRPVLLHREEIEQLASLIE